MTMKRDEKLVLFKSKYLNYRESQDSLKDMLGEDIYSYFIVKDNL